MVRWASGSGAQGREVVTRVEEEDAGCAAAAGGQGSGVRVFAGPLMGSRTWTRGGRGAVKEGASESLAAKPCPALGAAERKWARRGEMGPPYVPALPGSIRWLSTPRETQRFWCVTLTPALCLPPCLPPYLGSALLPADRHAPARRPLCKAPTPPRLQRLQGHLIGAAKPSCWASLWIPTRYANLPGKDEAPPLSIVITPSKGGGGYGPVAGPGQSIRTF